MARNFLFLLASGRREGNAELLAHRAARALEPTDHQRWLRLLDYPLPPFEDLRHDGQSYGEPQGHAQTLVQETLAATDLVLVTPLYWYSLPASAKLYLDYWSAWMRVPSLEFKARMAGKKLWAVCVLSDEDLQAADPLVGTLRLSAEYLQMDWQGVLFGVGNRPGDVLQDNKALAIAENFF